MDKGDFPSGPVVKNWPYNVGDAGSTPGQGTKIPHATGQLSPHATTTELACLNKRDRVLQNYRVHALWSRSPCATTGERKPACPQLERSPCASTKSPCTTTKKIPHATTKARRSQKNNNNKKKWTKNLNRHFSKEYTQMANKNMTRCSTSLVFREMQIKTKMRYHFLPTRMVILKNNKNNRK